MDYEMDSDTFLSILRIIFGKATLNDNSWKEVTGKTLKELGVSDIQIIKSGQYTLRIYVTMNSSKSYRTKISLGH